MIDSWKNHQLVQRLSSNVGSEIMSILVSKLVFRFFNSSFSLANPGTSPVLKMSSRQVQPEAPRSSHLGNTKLLVSDVFLVDAMVCASTLAFAGVDGGEDKPRSAHERQRQHQCVTLSTCHVATSFSCFGM